MTDSHLTGEANSDERQGGHVPTNKPTPPPNPPTQNALGQVPNVPPNFPVVGIGASAGGLEAFEQFFLHISKDSGMAFVLVSHLDPNHASFLTEILQRTTSMQVIEAADQIAVQANCVYVIPPNRDMAIFHGKLQLSIPHEPRGQRLPIDAFFRSLADDQQENAVGIILSGTGSDGTLGLRAILGAGGISLVQEPATAKYDGMPSSAIQAGYATHVAPAEQMPGLLLANVHPQPYRFESSDASAATKELAHILLQLRTVTGHDFSLYKKSTIGRRIERRMLQHNIEDMGIYARYLKENPNEVRLLFKELLINVTNFFRDNEAFTELQSQILPQLCKDKPENYIFRVWVAGCASGEEAYSLAILLREQMDVAHHTFQVQIYSTDLDGDAIVTARIGFYPLNISQDVSPERLRRFFVKEESGYRIKKDIREMVVFAVQNIIKDPPFTKLDLLSCRNVMIYLSPELQDKLIPSFHYALKPGGVLFLSPSESIGNHVELFTALNRKWKFYRARQTSASTRTVMTGPLTWAAQNDGIPPKDIMNKPKEANFADLTRRALVQLFAPASVVTDLKGNLLYVHGDTGKYLRPAPGQATLNIIEMAREGLGLELRTAITAANAGTVTLEHLVEFQNQEGLGAMALSVRPLPGAGDNPGLLLVSFRDVAIAPKAKRKQPKPATISRIDELERDLVYLKESHQASIEEQQASNEELKSANEELQSTNEELQSSNEELETSKEELQSVNEELITVNTELQSKIEQLALMQNDMKNLLDNVNVGIIFLDSALRIRRYTREAVTIYRLVATDVGRPLNDIKSVVLGDGLLMAAGQVLESLVSYEQEIQLDDGRWFLARILPYRTLDNVIDGVVLTFTDITSRIRAVAIQQAQVLTDSIINTLREPFIVLDAALQVVSANRSFYQAFQATPETIVGQAFYGLFNGQWDVPPLRERLEAVLPNDRTFEGYLSILDIPGIGQRKLALNARRIIGIKGEPQLILLSLEIQV
jgi:two-component system CheB/CheR fusion protein